MRTMTEDELHAQLDRVIDRAVEDHEETLVTRDGQEAVVIVSKADWDGIQTTLHLLSSPANAARLLASIAELQTGRA
ncbi:type II toxin-antitoxin system prevent-host-death family antitoxin [Frigidibacter sp. MR17.14]|uniref:type II toxin-antitoxin system Phd/YefM family antitoxin n=1 Tax=Frigidibacter sp. MR17.14 TaxID=3126509 RepID=UPI003012C226